MVRHCRDRELVEPARGRSPIRNGRLRPAYMVRSVTTEEQSALPRISDSQWRDSLVCVLKTLRRATLPEHVIFNKRNQAVFVRGRYVVSPEKVFN